MKCIRQVVRIRFQTATGFRDEAKLTRSSFWIMSRMRNSKSPFLSHPILLVSEGQSLKIGPIAGKGKINKKLSYFRAKTVL